ncbi:MAG: hypothetical protein B6I29_04055 [Marinitoga sp. 4572_148]|nr:MAG: hypothetical protein B6I29_04055 [Marinitoga sp. 4572_148]
MVSKEKFDEPNMKNKIFIVKKIKDTIQIDKIFEKIGKKIILVSSFEEKLKALEEKKGDIAIIDTNDLENTLKLQGYNVSYYPLELYFNVSRNLNREIVNKLDDYIEKYKADKNSIYYESLSTDIYGMKYTMPIWILNISIFFLAIFLTVSLTLYIYRKKYKKTLENLKEQNEKYKKLSIENKKQFIRLSKIINIITEIAVKEESINKFSNRLLNELLEIIPEGKYGSVSLIKRDRIFFLSTVGHDIELLRKIHIINKDFYLNKEEFPNIEIIDDILNKTESELHEKFKKASKPIKRSIIYTNKIIDDLYLEICIDTDSDKNFSDNSIELTKVFGNLGIAYFKYKIALGKSISERRKAENANKAKTVFLSQMSHDIRTPINGIMGMIYIIEKTDLNTVQRKYLKMLKNSAKILADLINDILDLSKLEANEMIIEKKKFNLEKQVEKIIDANSFEAFSKGLELSYYIEDNVPKELIGDTIKLKQILNNLLNNAIKFTSIGEVKIYISMSKKKNIIIIFKIIDTGRGIKKEQIENIFKPFIQEDLTIYRKYGGTGLGLSIVRKLVDLGL